MSYKTPARRAEDELNQLIGRQNRIYKPWQLENFLIKPVQINGTVDDVLLLTKCSAYLRPQFNIEDNCVAIPNLFAKLNGNVKGFYLDMKKLSKDNPQIVTLYSTFKKMAKAPRKTPLSGRPSWFNKETGIDVEAALAANIANIKVLRPIYQKNYLMAINRVLAHVKSNNYIAQKPTERDVLEVLLFNSNKIIRMYHNFDYQHINPKFIVEEDKGYSISAYAVLRLLMMVELGFDVFILSESSYASIENYLSDELCKSYTITEKELVYSDVLQKRSKVKRWAKNATLSTLSLGGLYLILKLFFGI